MSHSHIVQNLINLIGIQSTIRLIRAKGGREITFPLAHNLHDSHWLVVTVGLDDSITLCREYQGIPIKLPIEVNALLQLRNDLIIQDFKNGKSKSEIARHYNVDRKLVQTIIKNRLGEEA